MSRHPAEKKEFFFFPSSFSSVKSHTPKWPSPQSHPSTPIINNPQSWTDTTCITTS